jgi:hypothetical protein
MPVDLLTVRVVGVEVVGVVGESGDRKPMSVHDPVHAVGIERLDVDVRDPRVAAPLAAAGRPAGDLERLESFAGGPLGHSLQRQVGKCRRQQAELHVVTSTHRRSRSLSATASPSTFSQCPSANVG